MKISGIYSITNTINNKTYYGSSNDCERRFWEHKNRLNRNVHDNPHLQCSWNKHGESCFYFQIVEKISEEQLQEIEQQYLNWIKIMPVTQFYNIGYDSKSPARGIKWSTKSKNKLSNSIKGRKLSNEWRKKISKGSIGNKNCLGYKHTKKSKENTSKRQTGNKNNNIDKTIYLFKNRITGETFNGTQYNFYKKYNFSQTGVNNVIIGRSKSCKNWIIDLLE